MALRARAVRRISFLCCIRGQKRGTGYREIKTSRRKILCLLVYFRFALRLFRAQAGWAGKQCPIN